jgi:hypothetical protein
MDQAAKVAEATGTAWGRAIARGLRTQMWLAAAERKGDPAMCQVIRAIHCAFERSDFAAMKALADEHYPLPPTR